MRYKALHNIGFLICAAIIAYHASNSSVYAEPYLQNKYSRNIPLTSQQCNEFTFDATQSQLPQSKNVSYFWDFDDGNTSIEPIVRHIYKQSGDYTVKLSITDNSGFECSTGITSQKIQVNIPPKAFFVSEDQACINKPLTFEATEYSANRKKNLKYSWSFGDGSASVGKQTVLKSYQKGGDYKVLLTVDDQTGTTCSSQTIEKIIHINEPPHAQAGENVILKCISGSDDLTINFDASATTDINNDPLTYLWDFGDGNTAVGMEASHRYSQTGHYDVKLIVSDNTNLQCGTNVDFVTVKVNQAPQASAGGDITACPGDKIDFDGSDSYIHKRGTAIAQWFLGDGISKNGLKISHQYKRPGTYQATLTLENKLNAMCPISRDTRVVTINASPNVIIKSLRSECVGKEIFFDASSASDPDGDELNYYWSFGDGTTSKSGPKITHQYDQGGQYRVGVIVDDQKGTSCSTAVAETNVFINTPPIADAGLNQSCCVNKKSNFSASASSDPDYDHLLYSWDFGDGTKRKGKNVTHSYSKMGSYNVLLTVDDQQGSSCSQSTDGFVAEVKEVPRPVINIR